MLQSVGLNFKIRVIANGDFSDKILEPVLNVLGDVADTSELFMRSLQMYNLFVSKAPRNRTANSFAREPKKISSNLEPIEYNGLEGLEEMKIGVIVRTVLSKKLEDGLVSIEEVAKMQTKEYSKEVFDIQYPLLQSASLTNGVSPKRYYFKPISIYGELFFLCSEWYEVPTNNDRPHLIKWLELNNISNSLNSGD